MVQTPGVREEKLTGSPEDAVAVSVGVVPKFCAPGLAKVIVCAALGVSTKGADSGPSPMAFRALTVTEYSVPLTKPTNVMGLPAKLPNVVVVPPYLKITL